MLSCPPSSWRVVLQSLTSRSVSIRSSKRTFRSVTACQGGMRWLFHPTTTTTARSAAVTPPTVRLSTQQHLFSTLTASSLRNMVKPFFLKCHPDVLAHTATTSSSPSSKAINLQAIQNLNSYLDLAASAAVQPNSSKPTSTTVLIDFVIAMEEKTRRNKVTTIFSRRKVELLVPTSSSLSNALQIAARELTKLLQVANIPVPKQFDWDLVDETLPSNNHMGGTLRPHSPRRQRHRTHYEVSRDRFTARINWTKVDQLYEQAVADMHADLATFGIIRNHKPRRRRFVSSIVGRVTCETLSAALPVQQWIALRRLSLLLDQHFDDLHLEEFGYYWERCNIVLLPPRMRNTKRIPAYSFTLHPDNRVTIGIPMDFDDEELIRELKRNLGDFYELVGDGMDEIFMSNDSDDLAPTTAAVSSPQIA